VLRHIKNGDVLLMNRQPSLHRPSMQAHRVSSAQSCRKFARVVVKLLTDDHCSSLFLVGNFNLGMIFGILKVPSWYL